MATAYNPSFHPCHSLSTLDPTNPTSQQPMVLKYAVPQQHMQLTPTVRFNRMWPYASSQHNNFNGRHRQYPCRTCNLNVSMQNFIRCCPDTPAHTKGAPRSWSGLASPHHNANSDDQELACKTYQWHSTTHSTRNPCSLVLTPQHEEQEGRGLRINHWKLLESLNACTTASTASCMPYHTSLHPCREAH